MGLSGPRCSKVLTRMYQSRDPSGRHGRPAGWMRKHAPRPVQHLSLGISTVDGPLAALLHLWCLSGLRLTCSHNGQGTGSRPPGEQTALASPAQPQPRAPAQAGTSRQGQGSVPARRAPRRFLHSSSLHRPARWGLSVGPVTCDPAQHAWATPGAQPPCSTGIASSNLRASTWLPLQLPYFHVPGT